MLRLPFSRSVEPSRITLADRARDLRDWEVAARYYRAALDLNPANTPIWVQYGHALKEQGLLEPAEEAYRQSLALDEAISDTHLQLGHVLKLQGRPYEAAEAYLTAYRLDPSCPFATAELRTLWPGVAGAAKAEEFEVDPKFVEAVYGSTARDRVRPCSASRQDGNATSLRYRNCEHLLSSHWLSSAVLEMFDFLYYFHANPLVARDLTTPNRYRCLVHFCEVGINHLLPCNEKFLFNHDFYVETYLDNQPVPPRAAYRQWLNVGYGAGWHPNRQNWVKSVLDIDPGIVEKIDLQLYMQSSDKDETHLKWTDLFIRFIDERVLKTQSYLPITEQSADFFEAIASRFAVRGKEDQALTIYERVLFDVPTHQRAIRHRADSLLRKGSVLEALHIQNDLISRGENDILSYFTLAACYEQLGDLHNAVASLHRGVCCHPGDIALRRRFEAAAEQLILWEWQQRAFPMAMLGRFDEARECLSLACGTVSSLIRVENGLPSRPIHSIAIVAVEISLQCRLYRIDQKVEQLQSLGYSVTVYMENEIDQYLANIYKFDAVIFYRLPGLARLIFAINRSKELGITTYYEVDDLIFTTDFPDNLDSYAGLINMEEYAGLKLGIPLYRNAIAACDYGIVSTTPLAAELSKIVAKGKAFVHRNAFGRIHELLASRTPKSHHNDRVVIFYGSGTKAHKEDFQQLVEPALVEIVRRHRERVKIVLAGYIVMTDQLESIRDNLEIFKINWSIEEYWAILQNTDINIAVLKQSLVSDCKSELKWMEAAMFGIPSIVSGTSTYCEVIEPGVTGLICNTSEEWTSALDLLVRDSGLRQRIGHEAWRRVHETYNIEATAPNLVKIFQECAPLPAAAPNPLVLIVNVFYPPQAIGGATRVVHDNVRHLSAKYQDDFRIEVFTTTHDEEREFEISSYVQDGARVTALARRSHPDVESLVVDNRVGQIFGSFLDEIRPALIHFHCIQRLTASVVSAAEERGIPYLITVHDAWWISSHQFGVDEHGELALYDFANPLSVISELGKPAYDRMIQLRQPLFGAANVLSVSDKFADLYRRCGVPNVLTVENGVSHLPEPKLTQSPDGRVRLAFIAGIHRVKGYHLIKYALLSKRFEHIHVSVMDDGLQFGQHKREIWNDTAVDFFPRVPEDRVVDLYARIDVLVAPSIWPESFGLVTREALHFGCWVIASDRGSIGACVIEGVNGHIIDVSDASDLIRVLTLIDENPQRYLSAPPASAGPRTASEQGDELARVYKSLMAPPAMVRVDAVATIDSELALPENRRKLA
jgi:glycosyltransferase involved in cell wall biosynthesis/Flp pilus assembly protein TadD